MIDFKSMKPIRDMSPRERRALVKALAKWAMERRKRDEEWDEVMNLDSIDRYSWFNSGR